MGLYVKSPGTSQSLSKPDGILMDVCGSSINVSGAIVAGTSTSRDSVVNSHYISDFSIQY